MGWVMMSERELNRAAVLQDIVAGRLRATDAAVVLNLSRRQLHRLLVRFGTEGAAGLTHRGRGRAPNNALPADRRTAILALIRSDYPDFGPTLAAEKLAERHGLTVSRETLRKWMQDAGLWLSRKQRRTFH